jgi:GNAT superfamily N-acetyltransferase
MAIEVRDAVEADAEEMAPLLLQLMHEPSTADQIRARLRRLAATGLVRTVVAVVDGRVVGFASVHVEWLLHHDRAAGRLMSIVVDERCRGQGIGRRLVEAAVELARAAGCDRLELTSRLERADAHAFYEALGFAHMSKKFQRSI